jgi:hypothetical protein
MTKIFSIRISQHGLLLLLISLLPSLLSGQDRILLNETFDYPDGTLPPGWWSEGCQAVIRNGRLFADADTASYRASSVWLDKMLSGDLQVEFDAHIVSSSDTANNINCFFLYSDPSGRPLRESKNQRENGAYTSYHKLNGYIFTYLASGNPATARTRFRDNPGFNLLAESFDYECYAGKTYRIKIIKRGNRFQYWVDGNKLLDKVDDEYNPLHNKGHFGFRTWHTALWWDNLVITQLDSVTSPFQKQEAHSAEQ